MSDPLSIAFVPSDKIYGTSLQGYFKARYWDIVDVFGPPNVLGPNAKNQDKGVTCEWGIEFNDGVVATIYDYHRYIDTSAKVYEWHIGGNSPIVVDRIEHRVPCENAWAPSPRILAWMNSKS